MKIYIDTAPLIYLIEGQESLSVLVEDQLNRWISSKAILATSTLTLLELLVMPKKQKNKQLVQKYRALLQDLLSEPLIPINEAIAELAAEIRAEQQFKTPDSIQLATALYSGADVFFTNDLRLGKLKDIEIVTVR
ncbi:MAG: PIN domain-containing protein [Spirochaetales bacterium]|jgi:predicted nucleic acid-binding protein|nr:PIN domain-containing protein [Spirochaetales bacterium]